MVQARSAIGTWSDPGLERDILDRITLDAPWETVETFASLVRSSGSPEEREAVNHLIDRLRSWGVPHQLHEPTCFVSMPREATLRLDEPNGTAYRAKTAAMSVSTDGREITGDLIYVPAKVREDVADAWSYGLDVAGLDVTGKIVVADGMTAPGRVLDLMGSGALAGVFINPGEAIHESICTTVWGTPDLDSAERQP
ncbi:MAG: peptidase M28, partial [Chloroflexota bacterium]|nr:peptidase M28 [Chloroflexota bacterium]